MKQILCAVLLFSTFMAKGQSSQWQLCNSVACGSFNFDIIESSDTLFSSGCISVDEGLTWTYPGNSIPALSYIKTSSGIFAGGPSEIYHSNDNGISWTIVHNFGTLCFVEGMTKQNDTLSAAALYNGIWRSSDNGLTWTAVNSGIPTDTIWSILAVGNRLYAGTINNGIYYSDDAGTSWTTINIGLPPNSTVRSLATDNINIYASATGGVYYKSIGGASWTQLGFPVPNSVIVFCVDNAILAGGMNNLYRSMDHGLTWNPFDNGFPDTCMYGINSLYATDSYVFCGFGESFCSTEIYRMERNLVISSLNENLGSNEIQLNVFPNPFGDQINFETNMDINSTIMLYDITQRLISQQSFFRKTTLNTSKLESGVYFYEVISNDGWVKSGKILKQD